MKKIFIACLCALMVLPLGTFTSIVRAAETSGEHSWFFNQLDSTSKLFYNAIDQMYKDGTLKNGNASIDMLKMGLTSGQIEQYIKGEPALAQAFHNARDAFEYDHADVFYVNYEKLSFRVGKTNAGYVANIGSGAYDNYYADGFDSENQVNTAIDEVKRVKQEILSKVDGKASTEDKIKIVHDAIIDKVTYTYADDAQDGDFVDGIYGALVKGKAQCGGYAQALKYILDDLEIPTVLVFGVRDLGDNSVKEMHMWNYVQVDGSWFGMDVTWDDPIGGQLRYNYFLKGSTVFDADHSEQGQISAGGQNFSYPIPYNASLKEKNAGEVAVSGLSVTSTISEGSTYFRISYNSMGRNALKASDLGLTIAFRMMTPEGDTWASWMSTSKMNLGDDIDNGTAFLMPVTNAPKIQFAVTSAPDSLSDELGIYTESPIQEKYLVALGNEENVSSFDPSNIKPFAVSSSPSMFSILRNIDQDITVTYDEKLVENGQPISTSLVNSSTSIHASLEYVGKEYEDVKLMDGGTKTMTNVTYRFHPDKTYQGYGNAYTFNLHNLVGETSKNEPNSVTFKTNFEQYIPCPLRHYTTPPSAFIMSDPILIDDPKDDRFVTNGVSTNSLNIQLIATKPNADEQSQLDQTVESQTGVKPLVSNSYDIDLSCKKLIAAVKPGYHVTIGLPYPDGYDYNMNKDVVFKAYHFKKVDGQLVAEELICQITELGLVVIADSFSPFSVVAFDKGSVPEASSVKSVRATIENGQGTISTSLQNETISAVGLTAIKENETKTYDIKADENYVIERLIVDGKEVSEAVGKNAYSTSVSYASMEQNSEIEVDFVAKQVLTLEEKDGIEAVLPILELVKVDDDQKDDNKDTEIDDKKDTEIDDKKDTEIDDKKDTGSDDKKDTGSDDKKDEGNDDTSGDKKDPMIDVTYQETTLQQKEVSLLGKLLKDVQLLVSNEISDEAKTAFADFAGDNTILKTFDISLSKENAFEGELTLQFNMDSTYNGQTIQILHYVNGKVESQDAKVESGIAIAKVTSLSPFALMGKKASPVDVIVETGFDPHQPYIWGFLMLNLSAMLFVFKRNKATKEAIK